MFGTVQLFVALGLGRFALVADVVLTVAALTVAAAVYARARRTSLPVTAVVERDVVAEAESVVAGADEHQAA